MIRKTAILLTALCFAGDDPAPDPDPVSTIPTTSGGISTSGGDGTYWYATLETEIDGRLSQQVPDMPDKDQGDALSAVGAYLVDVPLDPERPTEKVMTFRLILTDPDQDARLKSQVGNHVYLSGIAGWHGDHKYFLVTRHSMSGPSSKGH